MENNETEIYFLSAIHKSTIWGGNLLKKIFEDINEESIGETWVVASLKKDQSHIMNGQFLGKSINELFNNEPHLFGYYPTNEFPILIKYIDAKSNLSIQVHPNDLYAKKIENSYGKSEFWLVLGANEESQMILGHQYLDKNSFKNAIINDSFDAGLNIINIHKNETYYVPAGTVHAICENSLIYEVQQNSKVTYRIYDYGRKDLEGNIRELHINKALDVSDIPMKPLIRNRLRLPINKIEVVCNEDYFRIESLLVRDNFSYECFGYFNIVGCVEGEGYINEYPVKNGDHILVPHQVKQLKINGNIHLIISTPKTS